MNFVKDFSERCWGGMQVIACVALLAGFTRPLLSWDKQQQLDMFVEQIFSYLPF